MSTEDWGRTARGFEFKELPYHDYDGTSPRTIQVQQSSLATEDKLWVGPSRIAVQDADGSSFPMERMHLGVEEVRWLRDALNEWLEGRE